MRLIILSKVCWFTLKVSDEDVEPLGSAVGVMVVVNVSWHTFGFWPQLSIVSTQQRTETREAEQWHPFYSEDETSSRKNNHQPKMAPKHMTATIVYPQI